MVICIVALVVFAVLGIFSTYYRRLAKEAFTCVMRMLVFQPCRTKLDQRIKSKVTIKLMKVPSLARFFYNNFKLLSWIFTITFFASMSYSAYGIYNLAIYGSCQPGSATCAINQGANQINLGINQITQFISCYEIQIVYGIVIVALLALLFFGYKYIKVNVK